VAPPDLIGVASLVPLVGPVFADGFETGDTSVRSATVPG
jgi:hypothetical protein